MISPKDKLLAEGIVIDKSMIGAQRTVNEAYHIVVSKALELADVKCFLRGAFE
jgi:hypothetical protein